MRIGELSRRTGVSERALRYYEEQGLLQPRRLPSGYREYRELDIAAVQRIRVLLDAGLNTAQIVEVLPCMVTDDGRLLPSCPELVDELVKQRDRIGAAIAELETTRSNLTRIIDNERR
ncbi:MerR family transcriptional regulator [Actinoalloteichus hymeniacidonis]|uniref:Transcriptional regulator n=1 Tax=Actinoalloteichus hymeniacidonis TaxID=340345 RepID=A0AAC9HVF3_9PSEU|nr:MerR family transcriptional regulator [Actinoalloteichus hymeniacidonis]AOS66084.1 putative transcriptional regulator [Actinoalloteichus hymeniacidonis]MBB5905812.1 DNA-binding transcriptional MerR regulator [Actinoalloteichus hymeniacidonis]